MLQKVSELEESTYYNNTIDLGNKELDEIHTRMWAVATGNIRNRIRCDKSINAIPTIGQMLTALYREIGRGGLTATLAERSLKAEIYSMPV